METGIDERSPSTSFGNGFCTEGLCFSVEVSADGIIYSVTFGEGLQGGFSFASNSKGAFEFYGVHFGYGVSSSLVHGGVYVEVTRNADISLIANAGSSVGFPGFENNINFSYPLFKNLE